MSTPFSIDFTAPAAPTSLTLTPVTVGLDPSAAALDLAWTPVSTAPENLYRIEVWANDGDGWILVAWFSDPAVTTFRYHFPRSGVDTTYRVLQRVWSGSNLLTGLWAEAHVILSFPFISLVSVKFPETRRVPIRYWPNQQEQWAQTQDWHIPAGGTHYVEMAGSLRNDDVSLSAQFIDEVGRTAEQCYLALKGLFRVTDPFAVRDPRGHKWFARFSGNPSMDYGKGGVRYSTTFNVRQIAHVEDLP
jgi:hypothetical protein